MNFNNFWRRYSRNILAQVSLVYLGSLFVLASLAPIIAPFEPDAIDLNNKLQLFSRQHLLGTDHLGRDMLTRLLFGAQVSLSVSAVAIVIAMVFGTLIGLTSGYLGGPVDDILMRFTDGMLSIPLFFLLLTVMTVFERSLINIVFFIGLTRWMVPARIIRSEVLKTKNEDYVLVAVALGASKSWIGRKHLAPQAMPSMIVAASLGIAQAILIESALSYLGLGIQPPTPSWGNMLFDSQNFVFTASYLAIFPGLLIFLTVLAYNIVGDSLRGALDPYQKNR